MSIRRKTSPSRNRRHRIGQFNREPYLALMSNIGFQGAADEDCLVALTSYQRREGVSTIASQLAITAAFEATNVLLIDGNEGNPSLQAAFKIVGSRGFTDYVRDGDLQVIQKTSIPNLSLMPLGVPPLEARLGIQFDGLMEPLLDAYDLIVLDLPAIVEGNSMLQWAPFLDCLLLIVSPATSSQMASTANSAVKKAGGNLFGVVQNEI